MARWGWNVWKRRVGMVLAVGITVVVSGTAIGLPVLSVHAETGFAAYNYAEALQKSLYFYDAEKSGPGITGGRLDMDKNRAIPLKPKQAAVVIGYGSLFFVAIE